MNSGIRELGNYGIKIKRERNTGKGQGAQAKRREQGAIQQPSNSPQRSAIAVYGLTMILRAFALSSRAVFMACAISLRL